jgi:cation/acetate symporter
VSAPLLLPMATEIGNPTVNIVIFAAFVVATIAIVLRD